jgi:large subunit ribosomal protein L22e
VAKKTAGKKTGKAPKIALKFVIDCSQPTTDGVMDPASFEKFLQDRVKVGGKTNNLGDSVSIKRDKSTLTVTTTIPFSKRYLKYLTKKFLKQKNLKDWLHAKKYWMKTAQLRCKGNKKALTNLENMFLLR